MAEDFCAIKHNNPFMNTFSDVSVCGDREVFKDPRDDWRSECWIDSCNKRRKGRKLLGGPIPQVSPRVHINLCCALKPEECCFPRNPYATSGLTYDAIFGFNIMFWIYVGLVGIQLWRYLILGSCDLCQDSNETGYHDGSEMIGTYKIVFYRFVLYVSRFTIVYWTFPLWFPFWLCWMFWVFLKHPCGFDIMLGVACFGDKETSDT